MIDFDAQLTYQFVVFFADTPTANPRELMKELSAQPSGGQHFGLKFRGAPEVEQTLTITPQGLLPGTAERLRWVAGAGVWRLDVTHARVDLFFDARGYADVHGTAPDLHEIAHRVAAPLSQASATLGTTTNRVAVVVTGVASDEELSPQATIASHFLNQRYTPGVDSGARDMAVRVNFRESWDVGHTVEGQAKPVVANRLETAEVVLGPNGSLKWTWDANVAVDLIEGTLSSESARQFICRGCDWIAESRGRVDPVRSNT